MFMIIINFIMYFLDHMGFDQLCYNLLPSNLVLDQILFHVFEVKSVLPWKWGNCFFQNIC
jgi:hypothetical protein